MIARAEFHAVCFHVQYNTGTVGGGGAGSHGCNASWDGPGLVVPCPSTVGGGGAGSHGCDASWDGPGLVVPCPGTMGGGGAGSHGRNASWD